MPLSLDPGRAITSHPTDVDYLAFLAGIQASFGEASKEPLYTTDVTGLFDAFLAGLPDDGTRQYYNCNTCRSFFNRYGGLVTINENGGVKPALFCFFAPPAFQTSKENITKRFLNCAVTGVFLTGNPGLGTPLTEVASKGVTWSHFNVAAWGPCVVKETKLNAGQMMAEKVEDYRMLGHALATYAQRVVDVAVDLLEADVLYRSEKVLGVAKWFQEILRACDGNKTNVRRRLKWRAVATAPTGFCHVRSSMIGTLLDDLQSGMSVEAAKARFNDKMHPLKYQRPQAPPKAGAIDAAEKIFEKMGLARSLERRFARVEELQNIWAPAGTAMQQGLFAHLRNPRRPLSVQAGNKIVTFKVFERDVLPNAVRIEYDVDAGPLPFITFTTAVHADAPPILQWDREDARNPVAWYVYHNGRLPSSFGLHARSSVEVTAVCMLPSGVLQSSHFKPGAAFILKGCVDKHNNSLGLFPECMRSELREVRSVIEAHSQSAKLQGREEASACGIDGRAYPQTFRVYMRSGVVVNYTIDRWE